jgi:uncharacterized protein DUF1918
MVKTDGTAAKVGDIVEIHGHRVGEGARTGEIVEVIGEAGHEHFRVRWADGRESVLYPASDAIVRPGRRRKARRETG